MDFTISKYRALLQTLQGERYNFITFREYCADKDSPLIPDSFVILRHDVDLRPSNSLVTARIEHDLGIRATYYFRAFPESWDEGIIRKIAALGHEIGYHYESLATCAGDVDAALKDFSSNLARLRELASVDTVCMHGSPRSHWDSKDIWKDHSYGQFAVAGEPYLDTDWSSVFYLTDTGRRWDGYKVSVRDKIPCLQDEWCRRGLTFHSTDDIIESADRLPLKMMINTHPQRWSSGMLPWCRELLVQTAKNVVKRMIVRKYSR